MSHKPPKISTYLSFNCLPGDRGKELEWFCFRGSDGQLLHWDVYDFSTAIDRFVTKKYLTNCITTLYKELDKGILWTVEFDIPKKGDSFLVSQEGMICGDNNLWRTITDPRIILGDALPRDIDLLLKIPLVKV